jgi:acyl-coenzyme A synthetase/AMP-(fatty) acid ligase
MKTKSGETLSMVSMHQFESADPGRIAVVVSDRAITYAQFNSDIACMAGWMRQQGLNPETRLGIYLSHPYWNWVVNLAAIRLGLIHAYVRPGILGAILESTPLDVLLGETDAYGEAAASLRCLAISPKGLDALAGQADWETVLPVTEAAGVPARRLMFTTGTTGKPKAVLWTAEAMAQRIDQVRNGVGMDASTNTLATLGIETTGGFRYPLATWQAGGCVLLVDQIPEGRGLRVPMRPPSTVLVTSPDQLRTLLTQAPGKWPGKDQRQVIVAGGRLPVTVRDEALSRLCSRISMTYGATETGSIATGGAELLDRHPGAVGFVRDSADAQIVDSNARPQPAGQPGIVRTRTPYMVRGYEGSGTSGVVGGAFRDGWFYPGDEGVLFDDGLLAITGRVSEVINIGGDKVSAPDIETALLGLPGVDDLCALTLRLDAGEILAIVVVCGEEVDMQAMVQQIIAKLPRPMRFRLVRVPNIPRNAMGKVPRQALAARLASLIQRPG